MKKILVFIHFMFLFLGTAWAQEESVEMADIMRSNGKIYVVVAVLAVILLGVFIYLFKIDKKVSNLEKEME